VWGSYARHPHGHVGRKFYYFGLFLLLTFYQPSSAIAFVPLLSFLSLLLSPSSSSMWAHLSQLLLHPSTPSRVAPAAMAFNLLLPTLLAVLLESSVLPSGARARSWLTFLLFARLSFVALDTCGASGSPRRLLSICHHFLHLSFVIYLSTSLIFLLLPPSIRSAALFCVFILFVSTFDMSPVHGPCPFHGDRVCDFV